MAIHILHSRSIARGTPPLPGPTIKPGWSQSVAPSVARGRPCSSRSSAISRTLLPTAREHYPVVAAIGRMFSTRWQAEPAAPTVNRIDSGNGSVTIDFSPHGSWNRPLRLKTWSTHSTTASPGPLARRVRCIHLWR